MWPKATPQRVINAKSAEVADHRRRLAVIEESSTLAFGEIEPQFPEPSLLVLEDHARPGAAQRFTAPEIQRGGSVGCRQIANCPGRLGSVDVARGINSVAGPDRDDQSVDTELGSEFGDVKAECPKARSRRFAIPSTIEQLLGLDDSTWIETEQSQQCRPHW